MIVGHNTKMGQNSSRSMNWGSPSIPNNSHPIGSSDYNVLNTVTQTSMTVTQPLLFPQSDDGYPLYDAYISNISSPFQILAWGNPFDDEYIKLATKNSYDMGSLYLNNEGRYLTYTYLYSITGWTAFDNGNATTNCENLIVKCPSGSQCGIDKYPNSTVSPMTSYNDGIFDIASTSDAMSCCRSKLDYTGINLYIFIQNRARLLIPTTSDSYQAEMTEFQAYLNAYLTVINQIEMFVGINPFCTVLPTELRSDYKSVVAIQLTYPYMIYAQLIMIDCWFTFDDKWGALLEMAINFVSRYARSLWTISVGDGDASFDYGYMERVYLSMYKQSVIRNKVSFLLR